MRFFFNLYKFAVQVLSKTIEKMLAGFRKITKKQYAGR